MVSKIDATMENPRKQRVKISRAKIRANFASADARLACYSFYGKFFRSIIQPIAV
jgi:hypothetical protein